MEVNATFYLVETFTSVSVQRPVVIRAVEVEIMNVIRHTRTHSVYSFQFRRLMTN